MNIRASFLGCLFLLCLVACGDRGQGTPYVFELPQGFPLPPIPKDNPLTVEKVELGRHLFYDTRLSGNQTQSCASCHRQALAFSDGRTVAVGSTEEHHFRNSQGLTNVAYATHLTWASSTLTLLEKQALNPIFGEKPVEMGMSGREQELLARLEKEPRYQTLFARAFRGEQALFSMAHVTQAIASFVRTIVSYRSPYDRYVYGDDKHALSEAALRGMELFFSERTECFHCHNGFNFSDATTHENGTTGASLFHNNGLYNLDGNGSYPTQDRGLYGLTFDPEDMGRFRAPSLRNVALTAPYMHDGSIATLSEVIDHYAQGGRVIKDGAFAGDGSKSPRKSSFVRGFIISATEKQDLLAFLDSLTDQALLQDPRFADPWASHPSLPVAQGGKP